MGEKKSISQFPQNDSALFKESCVRDQSEGFLFRFVTNTVTEV